MLTIDTAPLYLLEHGLVDARSITEGDLLVLDSSRRNFNFKVISEHGPSYLVKQGFGPRRIAGIANEAAMYNLLRAKPGSPSPLNRFLPAFRHYDRKRHLLITELLPDAIPLGEYHLRTGCFSTKIAAQIGKALSILHSFPTLTNPRYPRVPPAKREGLGAAIPGTPGFPQRSRAPFRDGRDWVPQSLAPPWVLSAHHATVDLYRQLSNANLQLVSTLQHIPGAGDKLDALRDNWRHSSLVHYDLKLENIIVVPGKTAHVKLVDWELSGVGDPLWDVGSIMGEYLASWLLSIPVTGHHPPDRFLELARYPLSKIQPAIRTLWQAYTSPTTANSKSRVPQGSPSEAGGTGCRNPGYPLGGAIGYAAARLIQTAFERSQTASALTGEAITLLQVAANILERPQEAAVHLFGIPPVVSWHVPTVRNVKRET